MMHTMGGREEWGLGGRASRSLGPNSCHVILLACLGDGQVSDVTFSHQAEDFLTTTHTLLTEVHRSRRPSLQRVELATVMIC